MICSRSFGGEGFEMRSCEETLVFVMLGKMLVAVAAVVSKKIDAVARDILAEAPLRATVTAGKAVI